jgi:hypothetical protein
MPHPDRNDAPASDRRRGPYETSYETIRGYDVPPPPSRRASDREPAIVAARREDPGRFGLYG